MTSPSDGAAWLEPGASAGIARRYAPALVARGEERPVTVDQTNHSVVVDESVIVKWFVPCVPVPHPGIRVLEHLAAVGFTDMPEFFAADVVEGQVVASVSEYLHGALDGWDWFVEEMMVAAEQPAGMPSSAVLSSARALGSLAARLHIALTMPSVVVPDPVTPVDPARELARCLSLLDEAVAVVDGEAAGVLRARLTRIREVFAGASARLAGEPCSTPAFLLHGDLHVGQVLRSGERLMVTDFDGNPLLDHGQRHLARPAAVDVASLVQSVDHAGRVAQRRRPELDAEIETLIGDATATTLSGYRAVLADADRAFLLDERLLEPLRVAQELHELVYAARHLPRWAYAPTATLRSMFPEPDGQKGVQGGSPGVQS
jgi:maltokinase